MKQESVTINVPRGTKIESQPRPKVDSKVIKEKICEKEKLIRDKKIVNK